MTPADYAQQVINEFGIITAPALSLNMIFTHCGIDYYQQDFDDINYCGSLHRKSSKTVIIVNTDIKNKGRINFTKSHEFGHFYMKHLGKEFRCTSQDLRLSNLSIKPLEVQANQFASAFLMPECMIKPIVLTSPLNFDTIGYIRNHFLVSKLSAAFKILDFTLGDYALISSQNGLIRHVKVAKSLDNIINLPNVNMPLPEKSYAFETLHTTKQMRDYVEIDPQVWLIFCSDKYKVYEHTRADKKSNTCLTLLNFIKK
jgi:Zn-dependent peptidase ImmA (M78 family)